MRFGPGSGGAEDPNLTERKQRRWVILMPYLINRFAFPFTSIEPIWSIVYDPTYSSNVFVGVHNSWWDEHGNRIGLANVSLIDLTAGP